MNEQERLAKLTRKELVSGALELGIPRPELLTRSELVAEITRVGEGGAVKRTAGFFGVARALLASVVEQGLNLPDAARRIRGSEPPQAPPAPAPLATITLAQIYGAQGHLEKALHTAEEILRAEPEHEAARKLVDKLRLQIDEQKAGTRPVRPVAPAKRGAAIGEAKASEAPAQAETAEPPPEDGTDPDVTAPPQAAVDASADSLALASREVPGESRSAPPGAPPGEPPSEPIAQSLAAAPSTTSSGSAAGRPAPGPPPTSRDVDYGAVIWQLGPEGKRGACALCWHVGRPTLRRAESRWGAGELSARLVGVTVVRGRTSRFERELALSDPTGSLRLDDVPSECEIRGALGWDSAGVFHVLATALVMERVGREPPTTVWKPRAAVDDRVVSATLAGIPGAH